MVDSAVAARKLASIRDALARAREVLPADVEAFLAERTAREVVVLNVFVAIQGCLDLASHAVADAGWDVPGSYAELFDVLLDQAWIDLELARRLQAASGFRNLIAHPYGAIDWRRTHDLAREQLPDLEAFCAVIAARLAPA